MTRISNETVALIREMKSKPCCECGGFLTGKAIARKLGLSQGTVANILCGSNPRNRAGERRA